MIFRCILFVLSVMLSCSLVAGEEKISVIIPCYHGHFCHLEGLLNELTHQTLLPDEVVISLSESDLVDHLEIEYLENQDWPYSLKIITSPKRQFPGVNRNIACEHAEGDLLICQDADDLPHIQRIEIIQYLFERYQPDHLMHLYYWDQGDDYEWEVYSLDKIPFRWIDSLDDIHGCENVHNGNIAIKKSLFDKIKWSRQRSGEDMEFNMNCLQSQHKTMVVLVPLILYRNQFSSGKR